MATTSSPSLSGIWAKTAKLLGSSRFAKNLATLLTGALVAQMLPLLASPILTRIYTPADYGVLSTFTALLTVATVLVTLRYEFAIALPDNDVEAVNVLGVALVTSLVTTGLVAWALLFHRERLVAVLGVEGVGLWLWLLPPSMLMVGVYQGLNYWCNRRDQFKALAVSRVTRALSSVTANLTLGWLRFGAGGMVSSVTLGQTIANSILARQVWSRDWALLRGIRWSGIREMAFRHRAFAYWNAPASLLDNLALTLPVLFIGRYYDIETVGMFGLANLVLVLPTWLVSTSIGQVFYQAISEVQRDGRSMYPIVRRMVVRLLIVISGPIAAIALAGPWIFSFAFGSNWRASGEIAQIYAFTHGIRFIVSPVSLVLPLTGNQRLSAFWKIGYFVCTLAILLSCSDYSLRAFLGILVANELLLYSLCLLFVLRSARVLDAQGSKSSGFHKMPTHERQ